MKVIIAGSRGIDDIVLVQQAWIESKFDITEVVSGTARGVDKLGEELAEAIAIPVKRFPAMWDQHGKAAGILRNESMGIYADALIAVWDGKSKGTKHMIQYMKSMNKPVYVKELDAS